MLPIERFSKNNSIPRKYQYACRDCSAITSKEWHINNPAKRKDKNLFWHFGITLAQYSKMLAAQNNVCKICKNPETFKNTKGIVKHLAVDHNHTTNKIRGLLCQSCNHALGFIKENFEHALNLAKYIQEDQGVI